MPRPTEHDPDLCVAWTDNDYEYVPVKGENGWWVHGYCGRVLKSRDAHRVRSRTTASLDATRDLLILVARERRT